MLWTVASPRPTPTPPGFVVKNGSKIRGRSSLAIPSLVSLTQSFTEALLFVVFVGTILATLATDLLIGIGVGVALEVVFHLRHGCPVGGILKSDVAVVPEGDKTVVLVVKRAAVFSNWLGVRAAIVREAQDRDEVVIDLSHTRFVDHSVMEKLHQLEDDFSHAGMRLTVIGLDNHTPLSPHPLAARKSNGVGAGV